MTNSSQKTGAQEDDALSAQAGSVYHQQEPAPRQRYPARSGAQRSSRSSRRPAGVGHAILLSNIRTFTLVALFMVILTALAAYMTSRSWQNLQQRIRAEAQQRQPSPPSPQPKPETETGVLVDALPGRAGPHVRTELDVDAMRRAVFIQNRAEALMTAGNIPEAIQRFHDALDIWPHLTPVWTQLGRAYLETRQFNRAQIALKRAAESDPANPAILNDLGVTLLYQNRINQALELFETAGDIDSNYAEAHFNRALCHLARDDEEQAEDALNAFLRLRPNDARALKEKAYLQASRQEYEAAFDSLRHALTAEPDWAPLYVDLAATAALMGRTEEAIRFLGGAEALTSADAVSRVYQQPAFRKIRLTEAGQQFETALAEGARERRTTQEHEEPISTTHPMYSDYRED